MKGIISILLCIAVAFLPLRATYFYAAASGGSTLVLDEGFEETDTGGAIGSGTDGYDDTHWTTESGTVNADFTPALLGSQSWSGDAGDGNDYAILTLASAYTECWLRVTVNVGTLPASLTRIVVLLDNISSSQTGIGINPSGTLKVYNRTATANTTDAITAGVTYYIWLHFKNDGTADIEFATTSTRVGSGNKYQTVSGGVGDTDVKKVLIDNLDAASVGVLTVDGIKLDTATYP